MKDDVAKVYTRTAMRQIPGGTFLMGSDRHYADERPAHKVVDQPASGSTRRR